MRVDYEDRLNATIPYMETIDIHYEICNDFAMIEIESTRRSELIKLKVFLCLDGHTESSR